MPKSPLARFTLYLVGLDVFLFAYNWVMHLSRRSSGVAEWVSSLAYVIVCLAAILVFRWFRSRLMWALRNRLIVTYVFIGVIPVVLLVCMGLLVVFLFVGQFATYVATSDLQTEIRRLDAVNERLASEIATTLRRGKPITEDMLKNASAPEEAFPNRSVTAWYKGHMYMLTSNEGPMTPKEAPRPVSLPQKSADIQAMLALDSAGPSLRASRELQVGSEKLTVISSVPLDSQLLSKQTWLSVAQAGQDDFARGVEDVTEMASPPDADGLDAVAIDLDGGRRGERAAARIEDARVEDGQGDSAGLCVYRAANCRCASRRVRPARR